MAPPSSTVNLGSCIAGVPVKLHCSFFILVVFYFFDAFFSYRTDYPMYMIFVMVLYGPVLLLTVLVHEFGHALTTIKLGGSVGGIVLWPLGGFALCGPTDALIGDLKVALAGPMTHVPMGVIWWAIYAGVTDGKHGLWPSHTVYLDVLSDGAAGFFEILSAQAVWLNLYLLAFNLFLPAYPLDGGRIYAASLILVFKMKSQTAAKVTAMTAMIIAFCMIGYAIVTFLSRTAGSGLLLGLVGVFVFFQSWELWTAAKRNDLNDHPIFGRQCYQSSSSGGTTGNTSSGSGQEQGGEVEAQVTVPAQTDEAVIV